MPDEVILLKRCLKGDYRAFEIIVSKYQELVCAITYSGTADVQQSEELAQQTFIKAWTKLSQLKDLSKFRSWLCNIARNNIRDFIRKSQRDIIAKAKPVENVNDVATNENDPFESAIKKEREILVSDAIQQIPEQYREPLVLYYRQQQSIKQVALSLDLSEDVVKQRLRRSRNMIKEQLSSIVEETLAATGPKKAFTTAVIASIAGITIKGSGVATAAGIAATTSTAETATGIAAIMSGVTAKIIIAAAVVIIGAGAVVAYKQITKSPEHSPDLSRAGIIVQEQEEEQSLQSDKSNRIGGSFAKAAVPEIENHGNSSNEDTTPASQEQGSGKSISSQSNKSETLKTGVSGVVVNKSSSKPVKGAQVFYGPIKNPKGSFFTDVSGHFEFLDMKLRGRQFFYIVAKDFTSRRITLNIVKDKVYENFKIELTPGSKVAGVVYDPSDKPVKGATVATFHFTNHPVVTDANGFFEIDGLDPAWGQYSLHVEHPNYPAFSTSFSPANAGETAWEDIVLKPGVTVYGQVTDIQGQPLANVSVGNTTSRAMWNCIEVKTDKEGKYELKNVDVGELVLWAVINKYAPYVERFSLDGSEPKKLINLQLSDPLPLYGKIVDGKGNPVPGVSISIREYKGVSNLTNWRNRVSSDSNGKFVIPNAPATGTVILSVFAEKVPNTHPELEVGQEEEYVIKVDRVGRVYGKVIDDKTGKPVKRFNVKLTFSKSSKPGWGYSATWNREGHNFDSAKGFFDTGRENIPIGAEYSVTVYADGFDPLTIDPVAVQPISDDPNRADFRLKSATAIVGKVVDCNSTPIAGARIRVLSDNADFEHWDDRDTAITNSKGEFQLSGIGSQEQCIYITAEAFAPYLGSSLEMPRNSEGSIEIVLKPGAEIFGRVFAPDGQSMLNAKVSAHPHSKQMRELSSTLRYSLNVTHTDSNGYYELFDLPSGDFSVNVNTSLSQGNQNFAHKNITLGQGQSMELNFGDESGFTVTGVVRIGNKPVKSADVQIRLPDNSTKFGRTDEKGWFVIAGVPEGTHYVYTNYRAELNSRTSQQSPSGYWISDRRQIVIGNDMELDIDLGDGLVAGEIPQQFEETDKLRITCRRKVTRISESDTSRRGDWEFAGNGQIEANGRFKCSNLRAGKYYILLASESQEVLGISDVFELAESEHLENIKFNIGNGTLKIHVVDAETLYGIPNAKFAIKNDLEAIFYSKKFIPEDSKFGMVTDDRGTVDYTGLPRGKYAVWVQTPGYLTTESDWVNLRDGETCDVTVSIERAAILIFELSEELKKRITADTVYLRCRVTNINANELVPMIGPYGEDEEHTAWLFPEEYAAQRQSVVNLPEGMYEIKYRLYQDRKGSLSYKVRLPLFEGTVNVTLNKGETKLITVSP